MNKLDKCLAKIAQSNKQIKAFTYVRNTDILTKEWRQLSGSPLIVGLKDNMCTTDEPTTCASNILRNFKSPYNSRVSELLKNSGQAVIVGKTNMDEFAMGSNNTHTIYGIPANPLFAENNRHFSTGGSSGGSAAAVSSSMCDVALGTDTGGSVRLPAAYCGVVGFKPSYGMISRYGIIAYAQSLDTVGIISRDVETTERVFKILNQYDEQDPTSLLPEIREKISQKSPKKLTIGIIKEAIIDLSASVRQAWVDSLIALEKNYNCTIKEISIPSLKTALPSYFIISPAEASSNLARYDGIRYGTRKSQDSRDGVLYAPTRNAGFGNEVQRRILLGTYNLNAGAYGNHFTKAQKVRKKLIMEFNQVFRTQNPLNDEHVTEPSDSPVDIIIHPTARTQPPEYPIQKDPVQSYINDVLTVPANLAGIPALSVPFGQPGIGIQIWGQYGDDQLVLDVGLKLQKLQNQSS